MEEDRISQLPDKILLLILEKIDIFQASKTSVLSNRWKNLWRSLPSLRLRLRFRFPCEIHSHSQHVSQFLSHRDAAAAIHDFHLSFDDSLIRFFRLDREFVEECLLYAINHGVQSLRLQAPTKHPLRLPAAFLTCETLRELELRDLFCPVRLPGRLSLPNLKTFHLETLLFFDDDDISVEPFSGLPELEKLTLVNYPVDGLVINAPKLRVLEITGDFLVGIKEISAPLLTSFRYESPKAWEMVNLPMLEQVHLDIHETSYRYRCNQNHSNSAPPSVATHTRSIGVIHPPIDIRTIVDKTAQFVAKNGPEFEKRIISSNERNAKYNFLRASDPYYQHRLAESRAQNQASATQSEPAPESVSSTPAAVANDASAKPDPKVLDPPEAEQYTVRLPEGITGEELDIIKLTAQFVARNGKSFLTGLTSNPQFHFLRPTHSMFADAYSKVLMPPKGLSDKLKNSVSDMTTVLERCLNRLEWERSQEQARQKAEDEIEQERLQMAMIDWHDFVVVESIDFVDEDLPPPMTLEEVIRRSKMSDIVEPSKEVEMEMDEEEVQLVEEGMRRSKSNEGKVYLEDKEPPMRIVKNWKRPEDRIPAERDPTKYIVSPITGELIPISEMSKHMRISLIDPKFKEHKDRMFAKIRETTLAPDDEISRNIVGLARTRPDIFGTTEEEVSNAVKAEIENKDEQPKQVIWDGHTGRTASQAMSQNTGIEDMGDGSNNEGWSLLGPRPGMPSIRPLPPPPGLALNIPTMVQYPNPTGIGGVVNVIPSIRPPPPSMPMMHGQNLMGNRPPMPPSMPMNSNIPVPPPQFTPLGGHRFQPGMPMVPPPLPEEPEPKRQRLDDSFLIPEEQFLAKHPGTARISISVPNTDEGNLKGQVLEITVQSLTETVASLKEKIAGEIQLPSNKQKLSGKAGFLKDNLSLAYYNVGPGEALSLSLRERGGRKR